MLFADGGAIPADRVDLWYVSVERADSAEPLRRYRAMLAPEEKEREGRLVRERDRRLFLISRALVRTTLSRYAPVAPAAWRFAPGAQGKPEIVDPDGLPPLRFNLTHTAGLVACAVALGHEVGVDAEKRDRRIACPGLAQRVLSRGEAAFLERLPEEERREAFLDLWTLREAYAKARGAGILRSLGDVLSFRLAPGAEPAVSFGADWPDDPARWRFFRLRPGGRHCCAVAVGCPNPADLSLRVRESVPLEDRGEA